MKLRQTYRSVALRLIGLSASLLAFNALAQTNFYEGKTVTLVAFTAAGGSGDLRVKAMRKTFKDPEFPKYFNKLVDDDPSPLSAADLARVVREMPRDVEVQDMLRKVSGADPLPPR